MCARCVDWFGKIYLHVPTGSSDFILFLGCMISNLLLFQLFHFVFVFTPFAVHYEKIRIHLREKATNSAKIHSLARKSKHLRINQIQLRFLNFNQHSITFLGIHFRHSTYKREKYTLINAKIRVINIILRINRGNRQTFKCKRYSLTFLWHCLQFNSIPGQL